MRVSGEDAGWSQPGNATPAESERRTTVAGARADGAGVALSERRRRATAPERTLERVSRAPGEHRCGTGPGAGDELRRRAPGRLNRHLLGVVVAASMADFDGRGRAGASDACLRLYDDAGRVLALAGCTAGYGGEGPHGTLWVLRLCGFPEGASDARGATALERAVLGARTFFLRRGARGAGR